MLKFKALTTADKQIIQDYTLLGERQNCDLSFANIFSWRFLYNTEWTIVDDFLVFRFYTGQHLAYMMPIPHAKIDADGKRKVEICDECSAHVIREIRNDSIAMGHPFLMLGVCNFCVDIIENAFPDTFSITPDRDYSDYIYLRSKLITLSGKKLQSKRNHINKFKSLYPDYEYRALTTDMIPECQRLAGEWRAGQEDDTEGHSIYSEMRSMTRAFDHWDELGLMGGTIWVDDKLIAFTYGTPINQTTFDICVEKADTNYEGAFTIINQEFAKHIPEQYIYINREEDMGDEGLRRAKLSYKPDILLEKNVIMEKRPLAQFEDQGRIKEEVMKLWKDTFHDSDAFIKLYFDRVYRPEYNICCQLDYHVSAALQTLPYPLLYHGTEAKTAYISGVSVEEESRKQNIGSNLMAQAHFYLFHHDVIFATLIPAEPWLYDWYGKQGYARCITCKPNPTDAATVSFAEYDKRQRERTCTLLHSEEQLAVAQEDIRLAGEHYKPTTEPIPGMLRIINAKLALQLWTEQHPDAKCSIRVKHDRDIPMNNAYYIIENGQVRKTDEPDSNATVMRMAQLAEFIFADEMAEMELMLN
ncbi:hypothetical protein HMPREF3034_00242 [Prevotella sp. DNF00663]|uniref:GNAT family N-acetyltransferase n=1 Tax=Prevotella sp. DNF00663 TaxID=1384078 RepID=UPI00078069DA|nr:GNAT family N-acetyltransferase [Prevotella sp. DNF00663]KXB85390.1 hypothetical protein HMPREF3034_00242 [Prevotella sp. DNF00663]